MSYSIRYWLIVPFVRDNALKKYNWFLNGWTIVTASGVKMTTFFTLWVLVNAIWSSWGWVNYIVYLSQIFIISRKYRPTYTQVVCKIFRAYNLSTSHLFKYVTTDVSEKKFSVLILLVSFVISVHNTKTEHKYSQSLKTFARRARPLVSVYV